MIRNILFIFSVILWNAAPVLAGYRELKGEFDAYRPSDYLRQQLQSRSPVTVKPEPDGDFSAQKKNLEAVKSRWTEALETVGGEPVFLRPQPNVLADLQKAATDAAAVRRAVGDSFSLETLEALALLRNPGIKAAESRLRGALEAFTQITALDEILRQYSAYTEGLMAGVGPMRGGDSVAMKFPFPGVLALKGEIVNQEVAAEREALEMVRRDVVTSVRLTYWNLIYVLKAKGITDEMLGLLRQLEAVAGIRYEAGKATYQDVIKVRINREKLADGLITLKERQRNLNARIREVLNLSPEAEVGKPIERKSDLKIPSLGMLYETARVHRQELRRLRAKVGKMERMIEMAETMILPPYTLNLSLYADEAVRMAGTAATKEAFSVKTEASRGAGLPKLPTYGIEDAYLRETRQALNALRAELNKAETNTEAMVHDARFELDRARRETLLYDREIVKLARSALDVSTRGYESGKVGFADVIDSYTTWLQSNLTLERNRSDLGVAWAKLEQILGKTINP